MRTLCGMVVLLVLSTETPVRADVATLEQAVQEVIQKAEPSVACILVSRSSEYRKLAPLKSDNTPGRLGSFPRTRDEDDPLKKYDMSHPDYVPESYGSGIIVDTGGLILTCAHVVHNATKIYVRLPNGGESYADIHALDGRSDLAVLQLVSPVKDLKPVRIGDADTLKKGQFVVTLSNPFAAGFRDGQPSASVGIISALRRRVVPLPDERGRQHLSLHHFSTLIQTDARLGLGCSGGALVNLRGELMGVLTARAALTGLETPGGFALPMTTGLRRIVEVLKRGEEVEYGFLGIKFRDTDGKGVQVADVIGRSPAQQAGIRRDDYLISIDGVPARSVDEVWFRIGTALSGNTIEIETGASPTGPGRKARVSLTKSYVPLPSLASRRPRAVAGLRVDHASVAIQRGGFSLLNSIPAGVLIREVEPNSPADRARLQPDKLITRVNNEEISSPEDFYRRMAEARAEVVLTLLKLEGGAEQVTLKIE